MSTHYIAFINGGFIDLKRSELPVLNKYINEIKEAYLGKIILGETKHLNFLKDKINKLEELHERRLQSECPGK